MSLSAIVSDFKVSSVMVGGGEEVIWGGDGIFVV